jgi:hypothetical protein
VIRGEGIGFVLEAANRNAHEAELLNQQRPAALIHEADFADKALGLTTTAADAI